MTQKVCDKCGNLISDINDTIFISGESVKHSTYPEIIYSCELCPTCFEKLKEWVNSGEKEEDNIE